MDKKSTPERRKENRDTDRPRLYPERFYHYHSLNASFEEVFIHVRDQEVIRRPQPIKKNLPGTNRQRSMKEISIQIE
ncbi:Hypothetical predicted protein [Olea europaea subsp. europaea]|uniref:Uncharacterized protein n=1 Tax=Olea europaea subsp. europaea TaxID=158383 RepID=A0A8S0TMP0_OLEEU|nr:Hypothetical predicted protein [Olea europaea subsp. europaea]